MYRKVSDFFEVSDNFSGGGDWSLKTMRRLYKLAAIAVSIAGTLYLGPPTGWALAVVATWNLGVMIGYTIGLRILRDRK